MSMTVMNTTDLASDQRQPPSRRACEPCHAKKTRCDRKRPVCGLCLRTGTECGFPSKRKAPVHGFHARKKSRTQPSNDRLDWYLGILENNPLGARVADQISPPSSSSLLPGRTLDSMHFSLSPSPTFSIDESGRSPPQQPLDLPGLGSQSSSLSAHAAGFASMGTVDASEVRSPPLSNFPPVIFTHLVELYFDKVQPWLPTLHKYRFMELYGPHLALEDPLGSLASDEALLLCAVASLAARYSSHEYFASIPSHKRGHCFSQRSDHYFAKCREYTSPTLKFLQGSILHAFYMCSLHGVSSQGWILVGVCVRLAYELGLSDMDEEDSEAGQNKTWSEKEELRRAWWLVWELDAFGSCVSSRPFMIDPTRMSVLLPVSDEAWYNNSEMASTRLRSEPGNCWKSLQDVENQSPRAWFLVANFLMSQVQASGQRKGGIPLEKRVRLENDITCLKLALPPSMTLEADAVPISPADTANRNWTMGIHLMLITASLLMCGVSTKCQNKGGPLEPESNSNSLPYRSFAYDKARVLSRWRPEEVTTAHPLFSFLLINSFPDTSTNQPGDPFALSSCREVSRLFLKRFSSNWEIGSIALKMDEICRRNRISNDDDRQLAKRYPGVFATPVRSIQAVHSVLSDGGAGEESSLRQKLVDPVASSTVFKAPNKDPTGDHDAGRGMSSHELDTGLFRFDVDHFSNSIAYGNTVFGNDLDGLIFG